MKDTLFFLLPLHFHSFVFYFLLFFYFFFLLASLTPFLFLTFFKVTFSKRLSFLFTFGFYFLIHVFLVLFTLLHRSTIFYVCLLPLFFLKKVRNCLRESIVHAALSLKFYFRPRPSNQTNVCHRRTLQLSFSHLLSQCENQQSWTVRLEKMKTRLQPDGSLQNPTWRYRTQTGNVL